MSDDWSLKGKGLYDYPDIDTTIEEYNNGMIERPWDVMDRKKIAKTEEDVKVYFKESIEILRQKLIEDLVNIIDEYPNVKKVINKRFGVE